MRCTKSHWQKYKYHWNNDNIKRNQERFGKKIGSPQAENKVPKTGERKNKSKRKKKKKEMDGKGETA